MHLILIAIILGLLLFIVLQMNSPRRETKQAELSGAVAGKAGSGPLAVAFVSSGKLFHKAPGKDVQQINSTYIQSILDKAERRNSLHSWKKGTSFELGFTGRSATVQSDSAAMAVKSADFVDTDTIAYFLSDGNVGGLFEQNLATGEEKRLLH